MDNQKLIKEFINEALHEGGYWRKPNNKHDFVKPIKNAFKKIKSAFSFNGAADEISDEWIEDTELSLDTDLPDDLKKRVVQFVRAKYNIVIQRNHDKNKISRRLRNALKNKFQKELIELRNKINKELDDDLA